MKEFNDVNFIPTKDFIEMIDFARYPNLKLLNGYIGDGRLKNYTQIDNIQDYIVLMHGTPNKFLKLLYFENIKDLLEKNKKAELLAKCKLVPLYYDVAKEIIIQDNTQYKPDFLLKDYISLYHKYNISNKEMFDNINEILKLVIKKRKDPLGILKPFIDLDGKVLRSATIPKHVFNAIDYWVKYIFWGNVTTDMNFTDSILNFYKKMNMPDDAQIKRRIFATKYLNFFKTKVDNNQWDEENMQSMAIKYKFLLKNLKIIRKYCPDRDDLKNDVKLEIDRINKLMSKCKKGFAIISGGGKILNEDIEKILDPFKNNTLEQIIKKTINSDCFLPDIPREVSSLTGVFPTTVFSDGNVKNFNGGKQLNEHGASDISGKWNNYEVDWNFQLNLFQRVTSKFDEKDVFTNIFDPIQSSEVVNEVSKIFFSGSLHEYFNENYFACIQMCVFQIESILREICKRNNIETISIEEDKERQRSMRPLILKLREHHIVNEKILLFIEWLLLNEEDQISKNYRNVIAHGLDTTDQLNDIYTKEFALSIILTFLSLSKYG